MRGGADVAVGDLAGHVGSAGGKRPFAAGLAERADPDRVRAGSRERELRFAVGAVLVEHGELAGARALLEHDLRRYGGTVLLAELHEDHMATRGVHVLALRLRYGNDVQVEVLSAWCAVAGRDGGHRSRLESCRRAERVLLAGRETDDGECGCEVTCDERPTSASIPHTLGRVTPSELRAGPAIIRDSTPSNPRTVGPNPTFGGYGRMQIGVKSLARPSNAE